MNNKNVYEKGLELVKAANEMYDVLTNIGIDINIDDQTKPFSRAYNKLMQNPMDIVCEALGLTLKEEKGFYGKSSFPITLYTYYPNNDDDDYVKFSITDEAMMDLIDKAANDNVCAKKVWECFAEKNIDAKQFLINEYHVIGFAE